MLLLSEAFSRVAQNKQAIIGVLLNLYLLLTTRHRALHTTFTHKHHVYNKNKSYFHYYSESLSAWNISKEKWKLIFINYWLKHLTQSLPPMGPA